MRADAQVIKAIVVDDEPLGRDRVRMLASDRADLEVVAECPDGQTAIDAIRMLGPDLVFLDVQMPGLDGLGVVRSIGADQMPATIFVTAYDEHAVEAFEVHALDYLLKPFRPARFNEAVDRALDIIRGGRNPRAALSDLVDDGGARRVGRILVKGSRKAYFIRVSRIDWVEAAGNYLKLHVGDKVHLIRQTMIRLEAQLDPAEFVRIHRSAMVNLDRVQELRRGPEGEYEVVLDCGERLRLSRGYRNSLNRFDPLSSSFTR